ENSPFARFVPMRPPGCCRAINEGNSSGKSVAEREPGALDLTVTMSLRRRLDHETALFERVARNGLRDSIRWGDIALDGERCHGRLNAKTASAKACPAEWRSHVGWPPQPATDRQKDARWSRA